MKENEKSEKLNVTSGGTSAGVYFDGNLGSVGDSNGWIRSNGTSVYNSINSTKEILDTFIYPETIEVIYKETSMYIHGFYNNGVTVYKEIYNRFDGSMQRVEGEYISPVKTDETYEFD